MTIPSLDGNGSDNFKFNVNIKQNSVPDISQNSISEAMPADLNGDAEIYNNEQNLEVSFDSENGISDNAVSDISESRSLSQIQVQSPEAKVVDEYSIKQFRKDYQLRLEKEVMPILEGYENERKKRLMFAVIIAIVCSIIGLFIFFSLEVRRSTLELAGLCFAGAGGAWALIKKSFENKIKKLIMPTLMKAMHGFRWVQNPVVGSADISMCKIFPKADNADKGFDDCFDGEYRNVPIAISECSYTIGSGKNERTIFKGAVIRIKMNKTFEGLTVVRPKHVGINDVSDLKKLKLQEVKLEDVEFGKDYTIYASDQIEARYLLTTAFMDRFKDITMAFSSIYSFCSFYGDSVYIAPYCPGDLFSLCSLTKPVTNKEQFEQLFNEIVSILQLIDHFKLDKKLGL